MGEWQLIESAPKSGVTILGWGECAGEINGPDGSPSVATICWEGGRTDYPGYEWVVMNTDAYGVWQKPTHWMPLPDRPAGAAG
jgi:hypothetical protein